MRILHLLDHSVPVQSGYAYRSDSILRALRDRGIETIQVTSPKHRDLEDVADHQSSPIVYERCATVPGDTVRDQLSCIRIARARLRSLIRVLRPDVIHAHSPCLNGIAGMGLGVPLVYEVRSSWEDAAVSSGKTVEGSVRYRLSRAMETFVVRHADAVVVICNGLREEFMRRGVAADRLTVVGNAIDPERIVAADRDAVEGLRARLRLEGRLVLGFFGSFFAWEGLDLLVAALPRILSRVPNVALVLAGGGEQEAVLRDMVRSKNLDRYVYFLGVIPHREIPKYYGIADLMVFPRHQSRLTELVTPLKPLEAMHLGCIVVASDVGGHRELIRNGETGFLFEAGSEEALVNAVVEAAERRGKWPSIRDRARIYVMAERTWASMAERYEHLYRKVLG